MNEVGEHAIVPAVKQPRNSFKDILEVCEFSLKGEQSVTKSIYNIVKIAEAEGDMASVDFLRFLWMNKEKKKCSLNVLSTK